MSLYFKRFEDITNKLKAEHPTEIADLNEEKISKLIKTRIKLYKKSVKDLQENQKVNALTDPHYTHFVYVLNKRAEMYELAKDILVRSRTLEAEQRRASRNNLYVLLSVHMQCVKHEESLEGFYINPIIEFLESDHSAEGKIFPEAKIFTDIISVKYENSKIKYDIEFKDDLHERWTLQQARLMSIENGDLSKSAESIASTYERFTDSFKALLDDSLQLSTLFEMFKPYIAQYKKEVTKQLNIIEMSINKEIPSTPQKKKKKRSKKAAGQPPSTDQGGIKTSTDTSDSIPRTQEDDEGKSNDEIDEHVNVGTTAEKSVDETIGISHRSVSTAPVINL